MAVPIPAVDRGRGDPRNLLGVIVDVDDNEQYTIAWRLESSNAYILGTTRLCEMQLWGNKEVSNKTL